jgi:nucleoporin NUP82
MLDAGDGGDATDIVYLAFGGDEDEVGEGETERLGVVLIAYQDGRVDVCLDVEKVEARWETKAVCDERYLLYPLSIFENFSTTLRILIRIYPCSRYTRR